MHHFRLLPENLCQYQFAPQCETCFEGRSILLSCAVGVDLSLLEEYDEIGVRTNPRVCHFRKGEGESPLRRRGYGRILTGNPEFPVRAPPTSSHQGFERSLPPFFNLAAMTVSGLLSTQECEVLQI